MRTQNTSFVAVVWIILLCFAKADEGAASIAEGGLVVMTREPRITMAKEVLRISNSKVSVDYDFRNDGDQDIETVVAFPIPPYILAIEQVDPDKQGFDDFRLWIDERPMNFQIECRAYVKGHDQTALLTAMKVDIATFGHTNSDHQVLAVQRLSGEQRRNSNGPDCSIRRTTRRSGKCERSTTGSSYFQLTGRYMFGTLTRR